MVLIHNTEYQYWYYNLLAKVREYDEEYLYVLLSLTMLSIYKMNENKKYNYLITTTFIIIQSDYISLLFKQARS